MNWLGPEKQIEVIQQGDVLLIKATGIRRTVDLLMPLAFAIFMYFVWRERHWISSVIALFIFGSAVWVLFRSQDGELRITDTHIEANGNRGGWTDASVQFRWIDISGLDFRQGGEDELSGLYARTGRWNATCLMAGLNREQSEEVIAAVFRRFPYVVMAEDKDGWSLFGNSELTTLDLSKPKN
ncbi:hypothetical protein [Granulicella sp. S190]|uniref:hypothetical protein n=1 Tax=Granulicella sp. S190 TaxID=1747226 RepID=UPI00131AC147|nr:hypothetical protein [Granulicella sp. S190]